MKQKGFSLIELMIVISILGGLSLVSMAIIKNSHQGQATAEMKMEEIEIRRVITSTLMDKTACKNTLVDKIVGGEVDLVKNSAGTTIFVKDDSDDVLNNIYGNKSLKISKIELVDLNTVFSDGTKDIAMRVYFKKMKKIVKSTTKYADIRIRVKSDSTGKISDCFADQDALIRSATEEACKSLGGVWDTNSLKCNLPSCPLGQVLQSVSSSGATCTTINCPEGTLFAGLDSLGNQICRAPTYN